MARRRLRPHRPQGRDHRRHPVEAALRQAGRQRLWRYDEVKPHWDKLMRSFVPDGGKRRLYQEGPVTNMRSPEELIRLYTGGDKLAPGTAMFCGTFAVHGDISYSGTFDMELEDPVLGRKLTHGYKIVSLPDEG